ncbi:MAG: peptidylprolyl isomerase [Candidatus Eisenbacteria bacterium]
MRITWAATRGRFGLTLLAILACASIAAEATETSHETARLNEKVLAHPNDAELRIELGNSYYESGLLDEAIDAYLEAIRIDSLHAGARINLGAAYTDRGDHQRALRELQRAVRLDPSSAMARASLGSVYHVMLRSADAVRMYREALAIDPNCVEAHFNLAVWHADADDLAGAVREWETVVEIAPEGEVATIARANIEQVERYLAESTADDALTDRARSNLEDLHFSEATLKYSDGNALLEKQVSYPPPGEKTALMETTKGVVRIKLWEDVAPNTVVNFAYLANEGRYDGVTFHRVIGGFMAQTGDVEHKEGVGGPGYTIPGEFTREVHHKRGVVSMARASDPDSGGSQFFIMLGDAPHLDGKYAAFGEVIEGMNVIDSIKKGDSSRNGTVTAPDKIISLRVTSGGRGPATDVASEVPHDPAAPGLDAFTDVTPEAPRDPAASSLDAFALTSGAILSGTVQTPSLTLRTSDDTITLKTSQISRITFEGGVSKVDEIALWNGDTLLGMLEEEVLVITLESGILLQLERDKIREISFAPRSK